MTMAWCAIEKCQVVYMCNWSLRISKKGRNKYLKKKWPNSSNMDENYKSTDPGIAKAQR